MLERVLEPEVMDTAEEARDYDSMDHAAVNTRFCDDFLQFATFGGRPALGGHRGCIRRIEARCAGVWRWAWSASLALMP